MISRSAVFRVFQFALVPILVMGAMGASDAAARFEKDSHQLMCVCGCNELLGECNHVGCPEQQAGGMRDQLIASIAKGNSDDSILHQFQQQYGPIVLAAPRFTRFNHVAWIMPPLLLFLGIAVILLIVRKWKLRPVPMPPIPNTPGYEAMRSRIRRETQL